MRGWTKNGKGEKGQYSPLDLERAERITRTSSADMVNRFARKQTKKDRQKCGMGRGKAERENRRVNRFSWARWRGRFLIGYFPIGVSVYTGPGVLQRK